MGSGHEFHRASAAAIAPSPGLSFKEAQTWRACTGKTAIETTLERIFSILRTTDKEI
jgi:hypothetical protein